MSKKATIKKWVAGMMLPVTTLGAVTGVLAKDYTVNSSLVSASENSVAKANVSINGKTATKYDLPIYIYSYYKEKNAEVVTINSRKLVKSFTSASDFVETRYEYVTDFTVVTWSYFAGTIYVFSTTPLDVETIENQSYVDKIVIELADSTSPVISGYEGVYFTNYDNPIDLEDIKANIKAVDETDGEVPIVVEEDNYSENKKTLGSHLVKISATDKSGNKSEITIDIRVVDGTAPTISGVNSYTSNMSSPITEATIRAGLTASDNVDSNLPIQLVNDNFTGNEQKKGTYTITYKAVDNSTNESAIYTVSVTTVDDIKPTITGTNTYTVSSTGKLEIDHIKSQLTASDNVDSNLEIELLIDGYSDRSSIVGEYKMYFRTTDSAGNESDPFEVKISVVDNIPPVFWISDDFFCVDETLTLSHQQILEILIKQAGINGEEVASYSVNSGMTYNVDGGNKAGTYALSYTLKMKDGNVIDLNSEVNVIGEENNVIDKIDEKEQVGQRVNKIKEWFKNTWNKVKDFFINVGKWIVKYIGFGWVWDKENKFNPNW